MLIVSTHLKWEDLNNLLVSGTFGQLLSRSFASQSSTFQPKCMYSRNIKNEVLIGVQIVTPFVYLNTTVN